MARSRYLIAALATFLVALAIADPGPVIVSPLFIAISSLPVFLMLPRTSKRERLVPIATVGIAYLLGFALFYPQWQSSPLGSFDALAGRTIAKALTWSFRGFLLLFAGYLVGVHVSIASRSARRLSESKLPQSTPFNSRFARFLAALGLISGGATLLQIIVYRGAPFRFLDLNSGRFSDSSLEMLAHYPFLLGYSFFYLYLRARIGGFRRKRFDLLFWLLILAYSYFAIGAGAKGIFLSIIISLVLPIVSLKGRWSGKQLLGVAAAAASTYLVFSTVAEYRDLVRSEPPRDNIGLLASMEYQVEKFGAATSTAAHQLLASTRGERSTRVGDRIIHRAGGSLLSFADLLAWTNEDSPFENPVASSLVPMFAFVPRTVWPSKPVFIDSGRHARMHGWAYGGLSVTLLGSFFWAWGFAGVCFGMAGVGVLLGMVTRKARVKGAGWYRSAALLILAILMLSDTGTTFQVVATNLVRFGFFFWMLDRFLRWAERRGGERQDEGLVL